LGAVSERERPSYVSQPRDLPGPPHGFVGRADELGRARSILASSPYLVLRGEHGEGKTTLAVEVARRLLEEGGARRVVLVSLEVHHDAYAVRFEIGQQLVPRYRLAVSQDPRLASQLLERVLREEPTLVVLDHLEAVLPPDRDGDPAFDAAILEQLLAFCAELGKIGETRLILTSREPLPAPFDESTVTLAPMAEEDALELIRATMRTHRAEPPSDTELAELMVAVEGHAGSLLCLAGEVASSGVEGAQAHLQELSGAVTRLAGAKGRGRALLAGVELSLRRLGEELRQKIRPLAVFQGGGHLTAVAAVLGLDVESDEEVRVAERLIEVGLAEIFPNNYLRLHPALGTALIDELTAEDLAEARIAWSEATTQLVGFLCQEQIKNPQMTTGLALLEIENLVACLEYLYQNAPAAEVVELATAVETLVGPLRRPKALERVEKIRDDANRRLTTWSHEEFLEELATMESLMDGGRHAEAVAAARKTLHRAETLEEEPYEGAGFDLATLHQTLGLALLLEGEAESALQSLEEARERFGALAEEGHDEAGRMEAAACAQTGDCLQALGRPESAAHAYAKAAEAARRLGDRRHEAEVRTQLGTLLLAQARTRAALETFHEAREIFEDLGVLGAVAEIWQQIGVVHGDSSLFEAAEEAFHNALRLQVEAGDRGAAGITQAELGALYDTMDRSESSVEAYRRAAELFSEVEDLGREGIARSQMADKLMRLGRYDEARRELERTVECDRPFGHDAEPWRTFSMLSRLEEVAGREKAREVARENAVRAYLLYRRDGGENKTGHGQLFAEVVQAIADGSTSEVTASLAALERRHDAPAHLVALIPVLGEVLRGSRDPALAQNPNLYYRDAAELLFQLETLERTEPQPF